MTNTVTADDKVLVSGDVRDSEALRRSDDELEDVRAALDVSLDELISTGDDEIEGDDFDEIDDDLDDELLDDDEDEDDLDEDEIEDDDLDDKLDDEDFEDDDELEVDDEDDCPLTVVCRSQGAAFSGRPLSLYSTCLESRGSEKDSRPIQFRKELMGQSGLGLLARIDPFI
jgi:hypothetical protein